MKTENLKKCPHCNGTKFNNDGCCEMCGLNFNNPRGSKNGLVNGLLSFNKISNKLLIAIIVIFFAAFVLTEVLNVAEASKFSMVPTIIMCVLCTIIGITTMIIGIKMYKLFKNGKQLEGTIVGYNKSPIIEYEVNNKMYRTVSSIGSKEQGNGGDKVTIKYDYSNPYNAMSLNLLKNYKLLIIGSAFFLVFAVVVFFI